MESIQSAEVGRSEAICRRDGRDYNIFFLRGHMRSGTNWCARLLNLHPEIAIKGEFHLEMIADAIRRYTSESWSLGSKEPLKSAAKDLFKEFVRTSVSTLADEHPNATWLGDQTPAPIDPFLEGAPHIVLVRDGRDVLVSWTFHQLRHNGPPTEPNRSAMAHLRDAFGKNPNHFKEHPEQLLSVESWVRSQARSWRSYVREHAQTQAKVQQGELDARILVIRYEELHADTETWRRRMYELLDLDPDLAEPISEQSRTTPGFKHDDPTKFNRKGHPCDWINYVNDDFQRWFHEEAGAELIELGYADGPDWR